MVKRIGGYRHRGRSKLTKKIYEKGKLSISKYIQAFKHGDNVVLKVQPSYHKGIFHLRFQGKIGKILKKRGRCYEVEIKDGNSKKLLVVHPVHLKKIEYKFPQEKAKEILLRGV